MALLDGFLKIKHVCLLRSNQTLRLRPWSVGFLLLRPCYRRETESAFSQQDPIGDDQAFKPYSPDLSAQQAPTQEAGVKPLRKCLEPLVVLQHFIRWYAIPPGRSGNDRTRGTTVLPALGASKEPRARGVGGELRTTAT